MRIHIFLIDLILLLFIFSFLHHLNRPVYATHVNPIAPIGYLDAATGGATCLLQGWTCDENSWPTALQVDVYVNDGPGYIYVGSPIAGDPREAAVGAACGGGTSNHGFNYYVSNTWKDGVNHTYYTFAISVDNNGIRDDNTDFNLVGSPKSMVCDPVPTNTPVPPAPTPTPYIVINTKDLSGNPANVWAMSFTYGGCGWPFCASIVSYDSNSNAIMAYGGANGGSGIALYPSQMLIGVTPNPAGGSLSTSQDTIGAWPTPMYNYPWQHYWWPSYPSTGSYSIDYIVAYPTPTPTCAATNPSVSGLSPGSTTSPGPTLSGTSVDFSWTTSWGNGCPTNHVTYFTLYDTTTGTYLNNLTNLGGDIYNYTASVTPGHSYEWFVRVNNGSNQYETSWWYFQMAVPAAPSGICGTYNSSNNTTPVTWSWSSGAPNIQSWDETNFWCYNSAASSPLTVSLNNNNAGPLPCFTTGRAVYGRVAFDWSSWSNTTSVVCPSPTPTPFVVVNVKTPQGVGIAKEICPGECDGVCGLIASPSCSTATSYTFTKGVGYTNTGTRVNLAGDIFVGVTPNPAGSPNLNLPYYFYTWPDWLTGEKDVDIIVASPTPTPFVVAHIKNARGGAYAQNIWNAAFTCGSTTGTFTGPTYTSDFTSAILLSDTCAGIRTSGSIYDDILGVTPVPNANYENNSSSSLATYGWPTWNTLSKDLTMILGFNINGILWMEKNNSYTKSEEVTEGGISNYTINLMDINRTLLSTTTTQASAISGYDANYIFNKVGEGTYNLAPAVTPTGAVLDRRYSNFTIPVLVDVRIGPGYADFPFITITPTVAPTNTPTPTPSSTPPPLSLTPTTILSPTITVGPGTPTPTPPWANCILPSPVLNAPANLICTNAKPNFSAFVKNNIPDSIWANFQSNEAGFARTGSIQLPAGGNSIWLPEGAFLNDTGSFWWTATAESPLCPTSAPAPARRIQMDYKAPPKPSAPSCTFQSQNLANGTGVCTWVCSWPEDPETAPASCSDVAKYAPSFRTILSGSSSSSWPPAPTWKPDRSWTVNSDTGTELLAKVKAKDNSDGDVDDVSADSNTDNESEYSDEIGGNYCPCMSGVNCGPSPTPTITGLPTGLPTTTPLPTNTPTATPILSPTPAVWMQVEGGDVYQNSINQPVPTGQKYLDTIPLNPSSSMGILWSGTGMYLSGSGFLSGRTTDLLNTLDWKVTKNLYNTFSFAYYSQSLKEKAVNVNGNTIGKLSDLTAVLTNTPTQRIFSYTSFANYTVDTDLATTLTTLNTDPVYKMEIAIFLISGSLEVTQNLITDIPVVFIVIDNGTILIDGNVTTISGLYINSTTFAIGAGAQPITINGMVYTKNLNLTPGRSYKDYNNPTYKFVYQPQYLIYLLPYLGRSQVNWQELGP